MTTVTLAEAPTDKEPRLPLTPLALVVNVPCEAAAETKTAPAGSGLVKPMLVVVFGPPFVTMKLNVSGLCSSTGLGVAEPA